MKQLLVDAWNLFFDFYVIVKNKWFLMVDAVYSRSVSNPKVSSIEETLHYIIESKCSVSRLGDGEIKIVAGKALAFQKYSPVLQQKMIKVLSRPIKNHIVCLPDIFSGLSAYNVEAQKHWKLHLAYYRKYWYRYIHKEQPFYNAFISRCYMMLNDKTPVSAYFHLLRQIWEDKDILLVEGEKSRLGVGNDLFSNVRSIKRILGPNQNAFDYYDVILNEVFKYSPTRCLVLLALGPTATVMAYDLAQKGYQAIDIGHVDIEYEWFLMGATHKVPVLNKFVNEAGAGKGVGDIEDQSYKSEIVCQF